MSSIFAKALAAVKAPFTSKDQVKQVSLDKVIQPNARDRWGGLLAKAYTPERVEFVLRGALAGSLREQYELFNLMEETSPRINKNLNQRKRAVVSYIRSFKDWTDEDAPATDEAKQRTKIVSAALRTMNPKADENEGGLDETIYDILDSTGKGISLLEIDFEVRKCGSLGNLAAPRCTRWVHPRFYGYPITGDWLGLNVPEIEAAALGGNGADASPRMKLNPVDGFYARLPENKFLVCIRKSKSGSPISGGLLRQIAFWWAASNFTQSWFLNFAQIFGLPIRWANYDPNIPGLMEKVCAMLDNMGSSAWAAFPSGTSLELKEPPKSSSENPQIVLLDMADKNYDLLILGQSGTTEISGPGKTGGSNAANKVLEGVEGQLVRSDADFVCNVINRQLIPTIVQLNFGDREMLPRLCLDPVVIEDVVALVGNYSAATSAGVITPNPEDEAHIRKKLSLPNMPASVTANWKTTGDVRLKPVNPNPNPVSQGEDLTLSGQAKADSKLVDHALADATGIAPRWLGAVRPVFEDLIARAKDDKMSDADLVRAIAKARESLPEVFDKLDHDALGRVIEGVLGAGVVNGAVRGSLRRVGTRQAQEAAV